MARNDRRGSEAAYQGADNIAERDVAELTDIFSTIFVAYVVGCRLGVYLLHKFSTAMEKTARVVTATTDTNDVNVANRNAVASSYFPSPAPNTNPNLGNSHSPSPSPEKKENGVRDYFKLWVRLVIIYEIIIVSKFVAEEAFGITIDIGFELPSNFHLYENTVCAFTYEWRLWNQLWRWRKDLLKMLGRALKATIATLRYVARGAGKIVIVVISATGSGIVDTVGLLWTGMTKRWDTTQRGNNSNDDDDGDSKDEESISEHVPTSNNKTSTTHDFLEATPEINTDHLAQKAPDRSCRSPKCTVPPRTPPRTPPQQRAGVKSTENDVDGDLGSVPKILKRTKDVENATDAKIVPVNFTSRPPVDQGSEVHCCTVDPWTSKEMWVHAQYFEDMDGEAVPGVFTYLPVTVLRVSCSEATDPCASTLLFSTDQGRKWYVQPGGKEGRTEWSEEDGRVIWEVPQASLFGKVNAEPDESCDACRRKGRKCNWTPDKLECLCDYCADVPRRHLGGCAHARDLGFNWARACDCLGQ